MSESENHHRTCSAHHLLISPHEWIFTHLYFLPPFFSCESFNTFFTIFCSSIKNARTILSRTQLLHREPPYARDTVFCGRETVAYSRGRRAGICDGEPK
jgi:hypothetical protein